MKKFLPAYISVLALLFIAYSILACFIIEKYRVIVVSEFMYIMMTWVPTCIYTSVIISNILKIKGLRFIIYPLSFLGYAAGWFSVMYSSQYTMSFGRWFYRSDWNWVGFFIYFLIALVIISVIIFILGVIFDCKKPKENENEKTQIAIKVVLGLFALGLLLFWFFFFS